MLCVKGEDSLVGSVAVGAALGLSTWGRWSTRHSGVGWEHLTWNFFTNKSTLNFFMVPDWVQCTIIPLIQPENDVSILLWQMRVCMAVYFSRNLEPKVSNFGTFIGCIECLRYGLLPSLIPRVCQFVTWFYTASPCELEWIECFLETQGML